MINDIPYQILIEVKLLRTRFDEIDGCIRIYNGYLTEYLTLFGSEKYDSIYGRIIYFISGITYIFLTNLQKPKWFLMIFCL